MNVEGLQSKCKIRCGLNVGKRKARAWSLRQNNPSWDSTMRGTRKWAHGLWTNSAHPPRPRRQSSSACAVLIVLGKLDISSVTCTATGFAGHTEHPLILHHSATLYWEFLSMSIALDMFFPEKMVLSDSLWCWYERCERSAVYVWGPCSWCVGVAVWPSCHCLVFVCRYWPVVCKHSLGEPMLDSEYWNL